MASGLWLTLSCSLARLLLCLPAKWHLVSGDARQCMHEYPRSVPCESVICAPCDAQAVGENRTQIACKMSKCEPKIEIFLKRCAALAGSRAENCKKCAFTVQKSRTRDSDRISQIRADGYSYSRGIWLISALALC